jgi:iron complex outermembrane receptor protein
MLKLTIIIPALFLGVNTYAQHSHKQLDTAQRIEEVEITAIKRKIETEMKMAVSVDEFLASSEQISFIKRGA